MTLGYSFKQEKPEKSTKTNEDLPFDGAHVFTK